jgi:hypothetical protein|nr:DUF3160 domain-containing protein [Candidatus Krumholzibacteria bacterium]
MICRLSFLILLVVVFPGTSVAQLPSDLELYGLDASDPRDLHDAIKELNRQEQLDAVEALRALLADTTLVERVQGHFADQRQAAGREENFDRDHRMALEEVAKVLDSAQGVARRLAFMRDENIHCAFDLPDSALAMLAGQGAVVMPWTKNEMYEWYDENYPFVTTDLVYHTFMILVRAAIDELENLSFNEELIALARDWSNSCLDLAMSLAPHDAELSKDNAALLSVAVILASDGDTKFVDSLGLDAVRRSLVESEVARVREASYFGSSPLLGENEDYSEYRARGRASGELGIGYFRARHWLSRAVFPVDDPLATRRALLLVEALIRHRSSWERWELLDGTTSQIAGPRDDPDVRMYLDLAEEVTAKPGSAAIRAVLEGDKDFDQFLNQSGTWEVPLIDDSPARGRKEVLGLRILAQRRSADGVLLQEIAEHSTWPISGLQVMAGLFDIPDEAGLLKRAGLKLPQSASTVATDSIGLMSGFRNCHEALFHMPAGIPSLFRSPIWRDKQVNAALGAWAESRHAAAPYLKSAHVYLGISMAEPQFQGYVEPFPLFYRRLKEEAHRWDNLCREIGVYKMAADQIQADPETHRLDDGRFPEFMEILDRLALISESELRGDPQTDADAKFLKRLGTRLRNLCFNHSSMNNSEEPMSRIIDVATEYQSGQVLEVGAGKAHAVFVAVNHGGETVVCRGSVYGYYEFLLPLPNRLDDSVWAGVSSGTVVFGRGPWLEGSSPLYYQPRPSPEELESIVGTPPGRPAGLTGPPWATRIPGSHPILPWVGIRVNGSDVAMLIELAVREDIHPDLLRFVARELSRHGNQNGVLDYCRRAVDGIVEKGRLVGRYETDTIRLFWALQVLAMHGGSDDLGRLQGLEDVLAQPSRENRAFALRVPVIRWLWQVAVAQCSAGVPLSR